jgi:tetratricopeptide (TPR) repeat protein
LKSKTLKRRIDLPYSSLKRKLILLAVASAAILGACSTAAVTGMKVHMQNQEYDDVIHLADSIIAMGDSLDPEVWFWRGKAFTEMNQWSDAAQSFWKADQLEGSEALGIYEYWFTFFNSAASTLNEGDIGAAVEILGRGMLVAPARPDFQLMLGDIELNVNNDLQAALDDFSEAADKAELLMGDIQQMMDETSDPYELDYYSQNLEQTRTLMMQSLFNSGSVLTMMAIDAGQDELPVYAQQAREAYLRALEADPTNVDMLDALAGAYLIEGDYQSALDIFAEAVANIELGISEGWLSQDEADALKADILVSKGYALIEMEQYDQAIIELDQARELIGDDYIVLSSLAHANFVMENYEESLSLLGSVLMIEGLTPDELANAYYMTYASYNRLEMDEDAAEALETALQFQPDNANYWRYLASTYSRLGRRNDAITALERAEELDPSE